MHADLEQQLQSSQAQLAEAISALTEAQQQVSALQAEGSIDADLSESNPALAESRQQDGILQAELSELRCTQGESGDPQPDLAQAKAVYEESKQQVQHLWT